MGGHFFHFGIHSGAHDVFYGFGHFGAVADELALRDVDFGTGLHQCQMFVAFLPGFLEFGPKELLHLGGYGDGAALVVDGGVGFGGCEYDTMPGDACGDGAAQAARVVEMGTGTVAPVGPRLGEEAAPGKVLVELVEQLYPDVAEDLVDHDS